MCHGAMVNVDKARVQETIILPLARTAVKSGDRGQDCTVSKVHLSASIALAREFRLLGLPIIPLVTVAQGYWIIDTRREMKPKVLLWAMIASIYRQTSGGSRRQRERERR